MNAHAFPPRVQRIARARRLSAIGAVVLSALKGQPRAKAAFEGALERKQISHAWLLEGPEGVGKELGARLFAQALTCKEKPFVGCGECSSCKRVERRNHPD